MKGFPRSSFWLCLFLPALLLSNVLRAQRVELTWSPSASANISHFNVYRTTNPQSSFELVNAVNFPDSIFLDGTLEPNVHYFWVVTTVNQSGDESGFSNLVDTTLQANPLAPSITLHPHNLTVSEGESAEFGVQATGEPPLAYQWQRNGANLTGMTGASYVLASAGRGDNGARFRCVVSNAHGTASSAEATLTVLSSTGGRIQVGLVALYGFEEGSGSIVHDVSGVGEAVDLSIQDAVAVDWAPGKLVVNQSALIASASAAKKVIDACKASNEITIEAWIKPAEVEQNGPARIVSLSEDAFNRDFTLGHGLASGQPASLYGVRLRTSSTDNNGLPALNSPAGTLTADLTHVAYVRSAEGSAKLYVNNAVKASDTVTGNLSGWDEDYRLLIANELTGDRSWLGEFHLVALYARALSAEEVSQNYVAGPGSSILTGQGPLPVSIPESFHLMQNHPNPFKASTTISYSLQHASEVELVIYDLNSREVMRLIKNHQSPGRYSVVWDGRGADGRRAPSGVYYYRIKTENGAQFRKMILMR